MDVLDAVWTLAGRQKLEELQRVNEQALQEVNEKQALQFRESSSSDESDGSNGTGTELSAYNFLVTSGTLIPTLVKCLLFKLNPYFNPSNSKPSALERTIEASSHLLIVIPSNLGFYCNQGHDPSCSFAQLHFFGC